MIIHGDILNIPIGWLYIFAVIVPILILIYVIRMIKSSETKREEVKSCNNCGADVSPNDEYCKKCRKRLRRGFRIGIKI